MIVSRMNGQLIGKFRDCMSNAVAELTQKLISWNRRLRLAIYAVMQIAPAIVIAVAVSVGWLFGWLVGWLVLVLVLLCD